VEVDLKKKLLSVAAIACLVLPAGSALAGEQERERTRVGIVAMDYHFMLNDGSEFPRKLERGKYRFRFRNDSEKRVHEVAMYKLRHGKTLNQLLNMPEEKVQKHIRFMGRSFAPPGGEGKSFNAKLIPGRYAMVCFVQNKRRAAPHVFKGMRHRFDVDRPGEDDAQ
jgi:hypothetical protein